VVSTRRERILHFFHVLTSSDFDDERDAEANIRLEETFFRLYEEALSEIITFYGEPDFFRSEFDPDTEDYSVERFLKEYGCCYAFASWNCHSQQLRLSMECETIAFGLDITLEWRPIERN
jgi:hypothetical protein